MRSVPLLLGSLAVALASFSQGVRAQGAAPARRNIDALVDSVRNEFDLPALAGSIVTLKGGTIALGVAGMRRVSGSNAVTSDDHWHLGSDFKAFTAMLAAIAVDKGRIAWTTTLAESFPELRDSIREPFKAVTLRDVLSHQGGIPRDVAGAVPGATQTERRNRLVRWALTSEPTSPRGIYAYSNVGYITAAAMLERALGAPFEDAIKTYIFTPLGITDAGFGPQADAGSMSQPVAHRRTPDGGWRELEALDNQPVYSAAGGAYMSLPSWGKFVQEILRVEAGSPTIVSALSGRMPIDAQVTISNNDSYGMGWIVTARSWAGGKTLTHTGSNTANIAVAWIAPKRGVAFLAVSNSFDTSSEALSARGADALIGRMVEYYAKPR